MSSDRDASALLASLGLTEHAEQLTSECKPLVATVRAVLGDTPLYSGGTYHLCGEECDLLHSVCELGQDVLFVRFDEVADVPKNRDAVALDCLEASCALWGEDMPSLLVYTPGISLRLADSAKPTLSHAMQWLRVHLRQAHRPPAIIILDPYVEGVRSPAFSVLRQFSDKTL